MKKSKYSEIVDKIKEETANSYAESIIEKYNTVPINKNMKDELYLAFLNYYEQVMNKATSAVNRGYYCEKCKDTGIFYYTVDRGSHFGAGTNEDTVEKFCDYCEKGQELREAGYKLNKY